MMNLAMVVFHIFQFLYGAIKSNKASALPLASSIFQFLYGAIKRYLTCSPGLLVKHFNSYMVRLKDPAVAAG